MVGLRRPLCTFHDDILQHNLYSRVLISSWACFNLRHERPVPCSVWNKDFSFRWNLDDKSCIKAWSPCGWTVKSLGVTDLLLETQTMLHGHCVRDLIGIYTFPCNKYLVKSWITIGDYIFYSYKLPPFQI